MLRIDLPSITLRDDFAYTRQTSLMGVVTCSEFPELTSTQLGRWIDYLYIYILISLYIYTTTKGMLVKGKILLGDTTSYMVL